MSWCLHCMVIALIMLVSANGAPILIRNVLKNRWTWPIDGGLTLSDGRPLFGGAKTWRGLLAAVGLTAIVGWLLGFELVFGAWFGVGVMLGDLSASFCKRRLGKTESSRARGFDTLPESLFPVWLARDALGLSGLDVVLIVGLFFLMEEFISPLLYKCHIRQQPF